MVISSVHNKQHRRCTYPFFISFVWIDNIFGLIKAHYPAELFRARTSSRAPPSRKFRYHPSYEAVVGERTDLGPNKHCISLTVYKEDYPMCVHPRSFGGGNTARIPATRQREGLLLRRSPTPALPAPGRVGCYHG